MTVELDKVLAHRMPELALSGWLDSLHVNIVLRQRASLVETGYLNPPRVHDLVLLEPKHPFGLQPHQRKCKRDVEENWHCWGYHPQHEVEKANYLQKDREVVLDHGAQHNSIQYHVYAPEDHDELYDLNEETVVEFLWEEDGSDQLPFQGRKGGSYSQG